MQQPPASARAAGFTVLEMLVTLAVTALLATLGLPALQGIALDTQRLTAINGLVAAIQSARRTAQIRNMTTILCQSDNAPACRHAPGRGNRWIISPADAADRAAAGNADRPLRVVDLRFSGTITANRESFEFRPFPKRSTNGTISLCDSRGGRAQRAIVIDTAGRPRVTRPASDRGFSACAQL